MKRGQECDCDFISSGYTVVEGSTLQWYEETHVKTQLKKEVLMVTIGYGTIKLAKNYVVVDVRGDSTDYSAFHVFDVENVEQVRYKGKIETKQYGGIFNINHSEWNNAMLN